MAEQSSGPVTYKIACPISATWNPQPDITAYELAVLLPFFNGRPIYKEDWERLANATRHLNRISAALDERKEG